jgi:hypothetical protein
MINNDALQSMNTPNHIAWRAYEYVCDAQDNACTIDVEQMFHLRAIMRDVPSMCIEDRDGEGDERVRWASRTESGNYLFVEYIAEKDGRYFVTSFIDESFEYFCGYMDVELDPEGMLLLEDA